MYFPGFYKKSTNSCISTFASSRPATSLNLILIFSDENYLAFVFPILNILDPPDSALFLYLTNVLIIIAIDPQNSNNCAVVNVVSIYFSDDSFY